MFAWKSFSIHGSLSAILAYCVTVVIGGCAHESQTAPVQIPTESPAVIRILTPVVDEEIANEGIEIPAGASAGLIAILNSQAGIEDGTILKKSAPYYMIQIGPDTFEWHGGSLVKWETRDRVLTWRSKGLDALSEQIESGALAAAGQLRPDENKSGLQPRSGPGADAKKHAERVEQLRDAIVSALSSLPQI